MAWVVGLGWFAFGVAVVAVVLHYHHEAKPVPRHLLLGMAQIFVGLALLTAVPHLLPPAAQQLGTASSAFRAPISPAPGHDPAGTPAIAPAPWRVPAVRTAPLAASPAGTPSSVIPHGPPKPTEDRHLGRSLAELNRRHGPGGITLASKTVGMSETSQPLGQGTVTPRIWERPDHRLTCVFGGDDVCRAVTYYRSTGFTEAQAVVALAAEIGADRPVRQPAKPGTAVTESGVSISISSDARTISLELPAPGAHQPGSNSTSEPVQRIGGE